jgi:hypothetical protein
LVATTYLYNEDCRLRKRRLRLAMRFLATLMGFFLSSEALAASPSEIMTNNTQAIVYIQIEDATGHTLDSGTGFIVSHDGYVVTAAHLKADPTQRMWATIGQREGVRYSLGFRDADDRADIAIWQLPQSRECQNAVTIGSHRIDNVPYPVVVLGFPGKEGLTPSRLAINNLTSQRGFYKADGFLRPGNSGGPVFNESGEVIAVVQGGTLPGTENNDLVPIAPAIYLLQKWGVQAGINDPLPSCRESAKATTAAPTAGDIPSEFIGVEIIYFRKRADKDVIEKLLNDSHIPFSLRDPQSLLPTDSITCTPDVPIEALKKLLHILLRGGVGIKGIAPSEYNFPKRITIENINISDDIPSLSPRTVDNLTSCPTKFLTETPNTKLVDTSHRITIKNNCPLTDNVEIHVRYRDKLPVWQAGVEYDVKYGEKRTVTTDGSTPVIAIENSSWFLYAEGFSSRKNQYISWCGRDDSKTPNRFRIDDKRTPAFQEKWGPYIEMTCEGLLREKN